MNEEKFREVIKTISDKVLEVRKVTGLEVIDQPEVASRLELLQGYLDGLLEGLEEIEKAVK